MRTLRLAKDLGQRIRAGHPWIYRDALELRDPPAAGELLQVVDRAKQPVTVGFFDPDSPIAVRALGERFDLRARVAGACALRKAARIDADALRLIHGENDFLPGLVLDFYAGTGVTRFDGPAAESFWLEHVAVIAQLAESTGFPMSGIWSRGTGRGAHGRALRGAAPGVIVIREGRARYEVDVVHGQKTGFFLDQRDNRRLVGEQAAGLDVLNLFAYTGGFSVAAALGGARRVTSVDLAAPAIAAARRSFALNHVETPHQFVVADAFEFLDTDRRWDLVVCDPPSFAPSARALPAALAAYRKLNAAAARAVTGGGLLATASCSSHVSPADFQAAVAAGIADARRDARMIAVRGAGPDHPTLPAFPEGRYLKFLMIAII